MLRPRMIQPRLAGMGALVALAVVVVAQPSRAYVALMAGQQARPLQGSFNNVPVLHSNQPEEVEGPGILINTAPGAAYTAESGQLLRNAEFTFNGEFGLHLHHKYFPPDRRQIRADERRRQLTLGLILINPGSAPVHIRFSSGAVRNSFEAPYLGNHLMGVKPLGPRPWNTGPGDATAVQMLRGQLDRRLSDEITIPARSRLVLFSTALPALGIANALLRGRSDGPFQMAVVAGPDGASDADLMAVLDSHRLAPGRVYLRRIGEINRRQVFSRVGGVALGDHYQAQLQHNLQQQGPLHVPLTSTHRHHFGTREIQVNPLATRMLDSSLDNVGTYGVRFDVDLNLVGDGPYALVMSHPSPVGGRHFTAFRGSMQVRTEEGLQEVHVGLRSGQSLPLTTLNLRPGLANPVRISLVYPADATPGHLLSVVPANQLARVQEQERRLELARAAATAQPAPPPQQAPPQPGPAPAPAAAAPTMPAGGPLPAPGELAPSPALIAPQPSLLPRAPGGAPPVMLPPRSRGPAEQVPATGSAPTLVERYQQALEAQQELMRGLMQR